MADLRGHPLLGPLLHVGIAVPDLAKGIALYRDTLGMAVSSPLELPVQGVEVAFVDLPNGLLELLAPLGENSPLHSFLAKTPAGGLHHLCFAVRDLAAASDSFVQEGIRVLGTPRPGAHGNPVLFLHPKDCGGTLIELEERAYAG